jgi:thiol-disulfide isomerase/thioredoxin
MARSLLCLLLAPAMCLHGQAPNPSAAGLDWVQQSFPSEAARVLAYVQNSGTAKVATISATVERVDADGAVWKVTWSDTAGKPIRERSITVASSRIEEGPAFYRDVFQQLAGEDWAIKSASPDNSATAYWQGAELGAVSRTEAITAASKLVKDKPKVERAADAARLAGVLTHAALPSIASRRPIDARLLNRGAAWLCICEKRLHEPLAAGWAPILFLAGRETDARDTWQSPETVIKMRTAAERFWARALTKDSAQEAFNFAARRENRSWALPALYLHLRKDSRLNAPAREIADSLDKELVARFHDYTPLVSNRATADAAWQRLRTEFSGVAGNPRGLDPVAYFSLADFTDTGAGATPAATAAGGRIADLTDEDVTKLASNAIAAAVAAPEPSSDTSAAPAGSPSTRRDLLDAPPPMNTADEMWAYLEKLKLGPGPAGSPEDGMRRMRAWLDRRRTTAEQFAAKYSSDPRRWEAVTIGVEAAIQQKQFDRGEGKDACQKLLDEVIAAPDATREVKATATFLRIVLDLSEVSGVERHTLPPFHRKLTEFIETYPDHPRSADAAALQLQLLESGETPGADKILEKLTKHKQPRIATQARRLLDQRTRFAELKKQPLELKFTAIDGTEIDFAKLRGKVVLLDFWASWCGPCVAEAPNVLAAYKKLHDRGFEIVGISLDQDRAAMQKAIERLGLPWAQHFDGKGWENEIAQRFGIRSIPATWLFDKQGKLRTTGLRGQELEPGVEQLLKE